MAISGGAKTPLDLIWEAKNMAPLIKCTTRQMTHMLSSGVFPEAQKIGGKWVIARPALLAPFQKVTTSKVRR